MNVHGDGKIPFVRILFLAAAFALLLPSAVKIATATGEMLFDIPAEDPAGTATAEEFSAAEARAPREKVLIVLMYHQVLKSKKGKYTVTPDMLEEDLKELKERGYRTVFPSEVIAYVEGKGTLPEKPLMITFDDGCYNNHYYGTEIMKKHGCKGILNIVGRYTAHSTDSGDHSKPAYSHLTWQQIKEIAQEGVFEIGNHTYNMHNFKPRYGVKQKKGESNGDYQKALTDDVMKLQDILIKQSGVKPVCFAYPFGAFSKESSKILTALGFKMLFNCCEKPNVISAGNPGCLKSVCRYNRSGNTSGEKFFNRIEKDVEKMHAGKK